MVGLAGPRARWMKYLAYAAVLVCAASLLASLPARPALLSTAAMAATEDAKAKPPPKSDGEDKQSDKQKPEESKEKEEAAEPPPDPDTLEIPLPTAETPVTDEPLAVGVTVTAGASGTAVQPTKQAGHAAGPPLKERQDSLSLTADNVTEVILVPENGGLRVPSETGKPKPPATKPAAEPQAAPAVKPAAKPPVKAPAKPAAKPVSKPPQAGNTNPGPLTATLPPAEPAVAEEAAVTLSEYFTPEELAAPDSESQIVMQDLPATDSVDGQLITAPATGVIRTSGEQAGSPATPTLGKVLSGDAEDQRLGAGVAGVSPWRSLAVMLLCLGLLFTGLWAAGRLRSPLSALRQKSLAVIETINIGAGRQIIIVEMHEEALVLGVTPHSINLLDKLPLQEMSGSYSRTVTAIIEREQTALPSDWQQRPTFSKGPQLPAPPPAPLLPNRSYGPNGYARQSVGEIRRQRAAERMLQPVGVSSAASRASSLPRHSEAQSKAELISRLRDQLSHLEH